MHRFFMMFAVLVCLGLMGLESTVAYAASKQAKPSKKHEECTQKQAEAQKLRQEDINAAVLEKRTHPPEALAGPLPENWQQLVKDAIAERLKDPDSAQFKFEKQPSVDLDLSPHLDDPLSAECKKLNIEIPPRFTIAYNWKIEVKVNAKNSFGGYVGFKEYDARIKNGRVTKVDISMGEFLKSVN